MNRKNIYKLFFGIIFMTLRLRVFKAGKNSLSVILPKEFTEKNNINAGDEIDLEFVQKLTIQSVREIKHYQCLVCSHQFDDEDGDICPACGEEAIVEIREEDYHDLNDENEFDPGGYDDYGPARR